MVLRDHVARLASRGTSILAIAMSLCQIPMTLRAQRAAAPSATPAPPGKLVDVGGWNLHLNCTGMPQTGVPTVVFESGAGGTSFDWYFVQSEVANFTRACSYDRAGTAWSDVGPHPRTVHQMAFELHTLLANAGVSGPYVIVGHSFGGIIVRTFQAQYPQDVAGMVLVDVSSDDTRLVHFGKLVRMRELTSGRPVPAVRTSIAADERETTASVGENLGNAGRASVPAPVAPQARAAAPVPAAVAAAAPNSEAPSMIRRLFPPDVARLRDWASQRREVGSREGDGDYTGQEFAELYRARRATAHVLGNMPLIVLIARMRQHSPGIPPEWRVSNDEINKEEEELARMSAIGKFIYVEHSTHFMAYDDPEAVTDAVASVIDAVMRKRGS
jgi:pimeloyl-ACP methyl ester carboxylesterase